MSCKKQLAALLAAVCAIAASRCAQALPTVTVLSDTGTLVTNTYAYPAPASTSVNSVPSPYGTGSVTVTTVNSTAVRVSFNPSSGFFASANNLAGGKTSIFAGTLAFDVTFDLPVKLTANIFEDGIYSSSGSSSRVAVNSPDLASGVMISQLDNLLVPEQKGTSFGNPITTLVSPLPTSFNRLPSGSGTWNLYSQITGFSKAYAKYHVVVDNDLIAESLANPNQVPGFAAISKKDFSIIFTFSAVPEPATAATLLLASAALFARRRRRSTT